MYNIVMDKRKSTIQHARVGLLLILISITCLLYSQKQAIPLINIRINQQGYLPEDDKIAILFSQQPIEEEILLIHSPNQTVHSRFNAIPSMAPGWGTFPYYYTVDFSQVQDTGYYYLQSDNTKSFSSPFRISPMCYQGIPDVLLNFMRQQRCGYNPFLDMVCHQQDGRSMYGSSPDSTFVDVSGGWHDAGDQLKYLITGSYATAHMLIAYQEYPESFDDTHNGLGQKIANGIPDVLDEARWGLEWIFKLHPAPDQLVHQVADDRDHIGWKMPDQDNSDYGWGPQNYRVAYFATGQPQGLREFKSQATGVANLAGRSAAAMALAARIWKNHLQDSIFANKCLEYAKSLYQLGKEKQGYQQGNSYGAPYRYTEETWADDMEWGAAELYKCTREETYLNDAIHYARLANTVSWMNRDSANHYQYYPFVNLGHYVLYDLVETDFKDTLAAYYLNGLEYTYKAAQQNPFGIGIPFIWCSNNLLTSLITQIILYEKMIGEKRFHRFMTEQRDWLLGKNPWGTSMFTGIPEQGEYPEDVHTSVWVMTEREAIGGLVDGPVFASIYNSLLGLTLTEEDEFGHLQNKYVVYHDDRGDYSTNEPTMDGTAGAILMMAYLQSQGIKGQ